MAMTTSKPNMNTSKPSMIGRIVRIRHMLLRWRTKATSSHIPSDVPSGHVAVCVGNNCTRFIVPATHLNHPIFKRLLLKAEEEYGFCNGGPLTLPCDESSFEQILLLVARSDQERSCYIGETAPLIREFAEKSVF